MVKIRAGTIQIQAKGAGRLSQDLVVADVFSYVVDKRARKIILDGRKKALSNGNSVRVWRSNPRNRSKYIALAKILHQMGVDWKDVINNNYPVKVSGKVLELQL